MSSHRSDDNPYLQDNFAPVDVETTVTDLPVTGTIPEFLDGRYLRNGPNPLTSPDPNSYHWFMGTGMVHGVRLRDGRAEWYRNRWVRAGDVARELHEPPCPGPVHAGLDFAANTHVIGHSGRTFAIAEGGGLPYELDDTLATVGACDFDGTLRGGYTAHPLRDPDTGELHAVSYYWGWGNKVRYSVLGTDGRVRHTVDIEVGGSPMMHAFSLTRDHVILYDLPVTFDIDQGVATTPRLFRGAARRVAGRIIGRHPVPDAIAARLTRRAGNSVFPYRWNPDYAARLGVFRRDAVAPTVKWFDIEPSYVFHPLNAYDDSPTQIVLDVVRHDRMFATELQGPSEGPSTLDRWTIDLAAGKVLQERLDDHGQEFPRIDERRTGTCHRYGYAVAFEPEHPNGSAEVGTSIVKHDLVAGLSHHHRFGPGQAVDEFVFAARNGSAVEDDGVVMGFVYDRAADKSGLCILDAQTMELVARVDLPTRVPHGFHGSWIPTATA